MLLYDICYLIMGCTEKLEIEKRRSEETRTALQFFSETHPLRHRCQDDLLRTEIRIFRLENRLKKFAFLKPIQLEMKKLVLAGVSKYYPRALAGSATEQEIRISRSAPTSKIRRLQDFSLNWQLFSKIKK